MVQYCDVCGAAIPDGQEYVLEIEGAVLTMCERCAKPYLTMRSVKVLKAPTQPKQQQTTQQRPRQAAPARPAPRRLREEELTVVENYAELIKAARESLGLSRDALAQMVGIKESVLRRIEAGQLMPDLETARRLERVLRIKLVVPMEAEGGGETGGPPSLTLGDILELRRDE